MRAASDRQRRSAAASRRSRPPAPERGPADRAACEARQHVDQRTGGYSPSRAQRSRRRCGKPVRRGDAGATVRACPPALTLPIRALPPAARSLARLAVGWTALATAAPYYPLYALLFLVHRADRAAGLRAVRAVVGHRVPWPRCPRARWPTGGRAAGASCWPAASRRPASRCGRRCPGLPAFAAGFVLWGLGGALVSGAAEALVYDGLAAAGAAGGLRAGQRLDHRHLARRAAAQRRAWRPVLFAVGGYPLVGWASVVVCLADARSRRCASRAAPARAAGRRRRPRSLRSGDGCGRSRPGPLLLVLAAVALLGGIDAVEEYVPVMAGTWGVPAALVPLAVLAVPLAGALGAASGGGPAGCRPARWPAVLGLAGVLLGAAALWARPRGAGRGGACSTRCYTGRARRGRGPAAGADRPRRAGRRSPRSRRWASSWSSLLVLRRLGAARARSAPPCSCWPPSRCCSSRSAAGGPGRRGGRGGRAQHLLHRAGRAPGRAPRSRRTRRSR